MGPEWTQPQFLSLLSPSRFLVEFLNRHPDRLTRLLTKTDFRHAKKPERLLLDLRLEFARHFDGNFESAARILREYRCQELARIAARDLAGLASFAQTGSELSQLAAAEVEWARRTAVRLLGIRNLHLPLTVIALGKMGGGDLNFSSDIDLLYLFDSAKPVPAGETPFEFYCRIAELLTRLLGEKTDAGFAYRVDLDLRPEGKSGSLTCSLDFIQKYYEISGASWERVALIKAWPCSGDEKLGRSFLAVVAPFVYPRSTDAGALTEIKRMKEKINRELDRSLSRGFHLKLGRGGIREIEFFVSTFQLLYGGKEKKLRERNTLKALHHLAERGLVPKGEASDLEEAYGLFRRIENRLQMVDDQQVHQLPTDPQVLNALATGLGFSDGGVLLEVVGEKTAKVAACFERLAGGEPVVPRRKVENRYRYELAGELQASADREEKFEILRRYQRFQRRTLEEQDQAGEIPLIRLFQELTDLAEAVLQGAYEVSLQELVQIFPPPSGPFAVVAMGKFGGRELTYHSDLDLIFLFRDLSDQEFYTRLAQRIISALTLMTTEGRAYSIDAALRPSGNAGTLVSSMEAFREYHREMARTWERQALIKARPVVGETAFLEELELCIEEIAYGPPAGPIAAEIRNLRKRMELEIAREKEGKYNLKTGRGGIVDIEFLVQYLQLVHGGKQPVLRTGSTLRALEALRNLTLLPVEAVEGLEEAYLFYRELETRIRSHLDQPADELREGTDEEVLSRYRITSEKVRSLYDRYLI